MQRNITLTYWMAFFKCFILFFPVFTLFLKKYGLNQEQIFYLIACHMAFTALLDIPTGYLSDKIGRKPTIVIACFFCLIGAAVYSNAYGFWMFLLGELTMSIQVSLFSGAQDAMLHESITALHSNKEDAHHAYKAAKARVMMLNYMAMGLGALCGGFVAAIEMRYTLYALFPTFGITFILACFLTETMPRKPPKEKQGRHAPWLKHMWNIICFTYHHEPLRRFIPLSAILWGVLNLTFWLGQTYQEFLGFKTESFGLLECGYKVGMVATAIAISRWASRAQEKKIPVVPYHMLQSLGAVAIVTTLGYLVCGLVIDQWCILLFMSIRWSMGITEPLTSVILNDMPIGHYRATLLSVASFFQRLVYIFGCITMALTIRWSGSVTWAFYAITTICAIGLPLAYVYAAPSFTKTAVILREENEE